MKKSVYCIISLVLSLLPAALQATIMFTNIVYINVRYKDDVIMCLKVRENNVHNVA